jgi:hypothetical protein
MNYNTCFFFTYKKRWLIESKRFEESVRVLKRIARINRVTYRPSNELERLVQKQNNHDIYNLDLNQDNMSQEKKESSIDNFKEIIFPFKNMLKLAGLFFVYCSVNLNYFSVAIGVTTVLKINPYLMYLLSSLFEFIGVVLCHLNDRIGRRKV